MRPLDLDSVAAFVMVADLRSFTRAAEAAGVTQSAISLKLKRLERQLGRRLIERTPRLVRLSADGAGSTVPATCWPLTTGQSAGTPPSGA